jgi:hypothetical protein
MRTRRLVLAAGLMALLGSVSPAHAQWMRLQRCSGALPCAIPFAVRYAPDPLIAAQYGQMSPDTFSGRIVFEPHIHIEIDQPKISIEPADFAARAVRKFVLAHPAPPPKPPETPRPE